VFTANVGGFGSSENMAKECCCSRKWNGKVYYKVLLDFVASILGHTWHTMENFSF